MVRLLDEGDLALFGDGELGALARRLARPSARILPVDDPAVASVQLGGLPLLPDGAAWPTWGGHPLDFVADVELGSVRDVLPSAPLPPEGHLLWFLATSLFGPDQELVGAIEPRSRPGWHVLHVPDGAERRPAEPPAAGPNPLSNGPYAARHGRLVPELTLPDVWETGVPAPWQDDDAVGEAFETLWLDGWQGPFHRIGGWPQPTQSGPAAPVALAAAGLVSPTGEVDWDDPRVREAAAAANEEWSLLLQLDTDDAGAPGWMWGDAGVVFFYGRAAETRAGDLSRVWCNWDCH